MFCKKAAKPTVCSVAAHPDQMDKNGCDFRTQCSPKPPNPLQTSSPQKSCTPLNQLNYLAELLNRGHAYLGQGTNSHGRNLVGDTGKCQ